MKRSFLALLMLSSCMGTPLAGHAAPIPLPSVPGGWRGSVLDTDMLPNWPQGGAQLQFSYATDLAKYALAKPQIGVNVANYGAVGDGVTDDTAAFSSALTAACLLAKSTMGLPSGVALVLIPSPNVSYNITSTITPPCDAVHIQGLGGKPTLYYSATSGSLFLNPNRYYFEVDHLTLQGRNETGVWGMRNYATSSTGLATYYHDLTITGFGDGSAPNGGGGGCMSIESDTQRLSVQRVVFACETVDFNEVGTSSSANGASDVADISGNVFGSQNGTGPVRGVNVYNQYGGPANQSIHGNVFEAEGYGALTINTSTGGWMVRDNESETLNAFTNTTSSSFEFLNAAGLQVTGNTNNAHGHAAYDFYVADAITGSNFDYNLGAGATGYSIRVGSGIGNTYFFDRSAAGPGTVLSAAYPSALIANNGTGAQVLSIGCDYPIYQTTILCGPSTEFYRPSITTTATPFLDLAPNLTGGQSLNYVYGQGYSTYNGFALSFNYVGAGSASNSLQLGLLNGGQATIYADGSMNVAALKVGGVSVIPAGSAGYTGSGNVVFSLSPALTGSPTAPTQSPGDNSTKIATTAFVAAANPFPSQTGNGGKFLTTNGTSPSWGVVNSPTAFVNATCTAGGCTINGSSLNVSSVTRSAAGQYSVNFAAVYPDTNYVANANTNNFAASIGLTTGHLTVLSVCGGTIAAPTYCDGQITVLVFGS